MKDILLNEESKIKKVKKDYEYDLFLYDDKKNYDKLMILKQFKTIEEIKKEQSDIKKELGFKNTTIDKVKINDNYLINKDKKIKVINELKCLKNEVKLYDYIIKDNSFIGYTLDNKKYYHINSFDKKKNKIKQLKLIRDKINLLNSVGIFIGNYNENNFLIDSDNNILISEIDNLKIGTYDIDKKSDVCKKFEENCSKHKYIDSFCFNVFTLSYLTNINSNYLINHIRDFYLPYILNTKENRNILESIKNLDDSYQPKYIIDNLR